MKMDTKKFVCIAVAVYFVLALTAYAVGRHAMKMVEQERDKWAQYAETVSGERDNANLLVDQWRDQYSEALKEIAELKSENEALNAQIDALREPPEGVYDAEFGYDYDYVVRVVGAEARGEPFAGILAVAQCIADTAERSGQTPEQVVKSGQYTSPVSRSCTDNMETVNEACLIVFAEHQKPFEEPIEYFYSTANGGYSAWHESQVFCYEIGNHRYFKRAGA